jgi:type VI secretion system protein ImpK
MQEAIANFVYPVISQALRLKDRLEKGERPEFETERALLKSLLTKAEAQRFPDFAGDSVNATATSMGRSTESFLGARFALVAWLDEIFSFDAVWGSRWTDRTFEREFHQTRDRAWLFWEQALKAEKRPGTDALEVFFLCVILGFRGELADKQEQLQNWVTATQTRVAKALNQAWSEPSFSEPETNVPPLLGRGRMRRMLLIGAAVVLVLILASTVVVALKAS